MKNPNISRIDWHLNHFLYKTRRPLLNNLKECFSDVSNYTVADINYGGDEKGKIYHQQKIDIELAFGSLKACLSFARFSVRGKQQVHNEIVFALIAVNLRQYWLNKRITQIDSLLNLKIEDRKIIFMIFGLLFYIS
ncbi:transposase [Enterococcus crotali]|uniref:transposase n=1 Tax=Enterococcus crotali TaxID=1453587 RepID=UPI0004704565